jgi:CxxC-x17-CxxC domain-containing protein
MRGGHPMDSQDKALLCSDCGITFTHNAEDQEFYRSKGYTTDPERCPECREARKAERYGHNNSYGDNAQRPIIFAVCANCGNETLIPFEPHKGKPVYCSDCDSETKSN